MRTAITVIITLLVSAGIMSGLWFGSNRGSSDDATPVRVELVEHGELIEIVSAPGLVQPRSKVSLSARVSARIVELPFKEGDRVTKGDPDADPPIPPSVLVRLDSKDLEAQLRAVEARSAAQAAQIEMARSQLDSRKSEISALRIELADTERELNRQKELLETRDVSQQAVDQAQAKFDQLEARLASAVHDITASEKNLLVMEHQLEAAQAEIVRASDNLTYTTITSPIDGLVTRLNAEVGELVVTGTMNNAGTVILEVADLSQMLVRARVDETSIAAVEVGQKATVYIQAYDDTNFEGTVQTVALASTEEKDGSKNYKTEILLHDNGLRVLSGLTADVDIQTRAHADVIRIPSQCVIGRRVDELPPDVRDLPEVDKTKSLAPVVFRYVDGKAVVTPVQVGPSDITHTLIRSGLSAGDRVITGPYKVFETLAHEQKVRDDSETTPPVPGGTEPIAKTNDRSAAADR